MRDIQKIEFFRDSITTLRETSYDEKNDEYMTESMMHVIDFDAVTQKYIKGLNTSYFAASNDALIDIGNEKLAFVEFKNGSLKKYKVRRKIYDSMLILCDLLDSDISEIREKLDYILVYNGEKHPNVKEHPSYKVIANSVSEQANEKVTALELEEFEGFCFNKVYTYNTEEFYTNFVSKHDNVV